MTRQGIVALLCCLAGSLFLIFRAHYYHGAVLLIPFLAAISPPIYALNELFEFKRSLGCLAKILGAVLLVLQLYFLISLNDRYCNFLLGKETEVVTAYIVKRDTRTSHGKSYPYYIYEYTYNNSIYSNQIEPLNGNYAAGSALTLRISTIDPTVSAIIP